MDNPSPSDVGRALAGLAWLILLIVVLLSLALALVSRRRYVAAILRLQGRSKVRSNDSGSVARVVQTLRLVIEELADGEAPQVASAILTLRRKLLALQAAGDIVYWCGFLILAFLGPALIRAFRYLVQTGDSYPLRVMVRLLSLGFDSDFSFSSVWVTAIFTLGWLSVPPLLLCVGQTAARRAHVYVPVALVAAASVAETWRVSWSSAPIWLMVAIGALGMAVLTLRDPRVRGAASPLIVALSTGLSACTVPVLLVGAYVEDANNVDTPFSAADVLVLVTYVLMIAMTAIGILFSLAYFYQRKRFSDVQLANAAFWLLNALAVIGMVAATNTESRASDWLVSIGALLAWTFTIVFIRGRWRRRLMRRNPPAVGDLLVLRVFKQAARSETFIDRLLSFWRFAAPVRLIAGPDLAGASIEPDEFFAFIRGRLGDRFVRTPSEISAQVEGLDRQRDPDGRFRVTELFCVEAAWRTTVDLLMAQAAVVLLDLREYAPGREGTRYEMFQLMNMVPIARIIVLLGRNDDVDAVSAELQEAWSGMSAASPNRPLTAPALHVCRLRSGSGNEIEALFRHLYARSMADRELLAVGNSH